MLRMRVLLGVRSLRAAVLTALVSTAPLDAVRVP
jgi:hypothetical protein